MRFELQQKPLIHYIRMAYIPLVLLIGLPIIGLINLIMVDEQASLATFVLLNSVIILLMVAMAVYIVWFSHRFASSLSYQLEDEILHIDEGVLTYQRKAIPLDRVTDIRLVQNLLMRWLGIWTVQVQTASLGQAGAEGTLWAIEAPKATRDQLLTARNTAVRKGIVETAV